MRVKHICLLAVFTLLLTPCQPVGAEVIIDWVMVGDPGNARDVDGRGQLGRVDYVYRIGKYEVTNAQYCEFLNNVDLNGTNLLGLYNDAIASSDAGDGIMFDAGAAVGAKYSVALGRGNCPVVYASFWSACRFANWFHNGQNPDGTENGAYALNGVVNPPPPGEGIVREPGARAFLPTDDEWYKAAAYKGGGPDAGYWDYATQSDVLPVAEPPPGGANSANYDMAVGVAVDVGSYVHAPSAYGTFDQAGNVWEMTDVRPDQNKATIRGGSFHSSELRIGADCGYIVPADQSIALGRHYRNGFRLAAIPEPATLSLLALGSLLLIRRRAG